MRGGGVQAFQREQVRGVGVGRGVGRGGMSKISTADSDLSDETEAAQVEVKLTRMRQGETF